MQINRATLPLALALRHAGPLRRLRGWDRLLRLLFHPDQQDDFRFEVPFERLRYPGRADQFIDWRTLFYGAYEADLLSVLAQEADHFPGLVFLDVGANLGHHTLFMAAHGAEVHAFEPNPRLWPLFEEKVTRNGLTSITLHRIGLADVDAELPFYARSEGANSGTASFVAGHSTDNASTPVTSPVRRGDAYLEQAGVRRIDLVKIDVEGFEPQVLRGLRGTLERDRPVVAVEVNHTSRPVFGDVAGLRSHLPPGYALSYLCRTSWFWTHHAEAPLTEAAFATLNGEVICRPTRRGHQKA